MVKVQNKPGDLLENSIKTNVAMVTAGLAHNKPVLEHLVDEGKLKIVGAYYDLDDGSVEFLDRYFYRKSHRFPRYISTASPEAACTHPSVPAV